MSSKTDEQGNPELLKEQIRIKTSEVKRLEGEIERHGEKLKHVLQTNHKKIRELQDKISEQEQETRFHQNIAGDLIKKNQQRESQEKAETDISNEENELNRQRLDRAISHLKTLKENNRQLTLKLERETAQRDSMIKEKGLLAREIQRLRNLREPELDGALKGRVVQLEKEMEESRNRFETLIREKDGLILSYTNTLNEMTEAGGTTPQELFKIQSELETLKRDKQKLEDKIVRERKLHKARLSRDIKFLEEQIEERMKKKLKRRKRTGNLETTEQDSIGDGWMTTYADMVTLLLTFFILYYSIASVTMKQLRAAVSDEPHSSAAVIEILESAEQPQTLEALSGMKPQEILQEMKQIAEQEGLRDLLEVDGNRNRVVIQVPGEALFASGTADLNLKTSRTALDTVVNLAKKYPGYRIQIGGHTDDTPISTDRYPTNWELSAARATAVLRYFLDRNIRATRVTALGYADTFPVARNDTPSGRKLNRRVEIVLEKKD